MVRPDLLATVRLLSTKEGGRRSPTPISFLSCQLYLGADCFDCRLLFENVGSMTPGQQADVRIKFLTPNIALPRLKVGTAFMLREGGTKIGEGAIKEIFASNERFVEREKVIRELIDLKDEQLSSVCFVTDYVELDFNGPVLRSIANPWVTGPGGLRIQFPNSGSRDALCRLIGRYVQGVDVKRGESLKVDFGEEYQFIIPLDPNSAQAGENMHFVVPGEPMRVW